MSLTRREVLSAAAAALLARSLPAFPGGDVTGRVVIVGGGFGGISCARSLRRYAPRLDVVVVEPRDRFVTGPMSNPALVGMRSPASVRVATADAARASGFEWRRSAAIAIDPVRRAVRLDDGSTLTADRIVLSPGIRMRYEDIEGLDAAGSDAVPHAWLGDHQFDLLRRRIAALGDGAVVAIGAPAGLYRCPPGPYERAALIAWDLARRGLRRARLLILDGKDDFTKRALFQAGWDELYPGQVEWVPRAAGGQVVGVDPQAGRLRLQNGETIRADLISLIPPQEAADLAQAADLADADGWCAIDPHSFESSRHAGIHVIGDAASVGPVPKSAYAANAQGKLCALAVIAALEGRRTGDGLLVNTCFSLLAPEYGISVSASYAVVGDRWNTLSSGQSPGAAAAALRRREAEYASGWYRNLMSDSFGL